MYFMQKDIKISLPELAKHMSSLYEICDNANVGLYKYSYRDIAIIATEAHERICWLERENKQLDKLINQLSEKCLKLQK